MPNGKILLVDDEPRILASLTRSLNEYNYSEVQTAREGEEAISILKKTTDLALIVSDYHMPGMKGIDLLMYAQKINPDITRVILTGVADLNMAIDAVNRANVFRLLLKPCPTETFIAVVDAGIRQYQLVTSERILLTKTLGGSVKILMDILSALNPEIFARANRVRSLASELAKVLGLDQTWDVELSALLSQIGTVTVPQDTLEKWQKGEMLDENEQMMVQAIPQIGSRWIKNIPRLEHIAEAVKYQDCNYNPSEKINGIPEGDEIPIISRILKIVNDYDTQYEKIQDIEMTLVELINSKGIYDEHILNEFRSKVLNMVSGVYFKPKGAEERIFSIDQLEPGMTFSKNVYDNQGRLIVVGGTEVTEVLKIRLINFSRSHLLRQPMIVYK